MIAEYTISKTANKTELSKGKEKELSFAYLLGLIETDGCFQLLFKKDLRMPIKYRIQPIVQLSQKNLELLKSAYCTLKNKKISSKLYNSPAPTRGGRAPCLRIEGIKHVREFLLECQAEKNKSGALFCGIKLVDFFLMQAVYSIIDKGTHNSAQGRAYIIDLKFALHKPPLELTQCNHRLFKDLDVKKNAFSEKILSQQDWEKRHGLSTACSLNSSELFKEQVSRKYTDFVELVLSKKISLSPDFVSGVLEGDGCLYTNANKPRECSMSLVAERGSEALLLCVLDYLKDEAPTFYRGSKSNCTYYLARRKDLLVRLCTHLRSYPLLFKEDSQRRFLGCCAKRKLVST